MLLIFCTTNKVRKILYLRNIATITYCQLWTKHTIACQTGWHEFHKWLSTSDFSKTKRKYKVKVPIVEEVLKTSNSSRRTDAFVLPLSLEDKATIAGTSAILTEFETEFLPYDTLNGQFNLNQARSWFEYMMSHSKHLDDMANFE